MPRNQIVLTVAGALVGLGVAVALFLKFGPDTAAPAQLRGYRIVPGGVEVSFEVARAPGTQVHCVLRARDRFGRQVGRRTVDVPVTPRRDLVVTQTVPATGVPVTGELVGCLPGPAPSLSPRPAP